jgi:sacsin
MNFGTDFGQKVDLTASIRNILRNYPEGTAILKELVQNADDAGASHISFCLDCRYHPTTTLAGPALSGFQGPSLMVYNNAVFTEEDFRSIQRIGDSLKKTTENKGKIGRFGIGFNAVYHWTDLPSFISARYLVLLDPQAIFLPNVNPSNPGTCVFPAPVFFNI